MAQHKIEDDRTKKLVSVVGLPIDNTQVVLRGQGSVAQQHKRKQTGTFFLLLTFEFPFALGHSSP